jgi:hypothetical protein
LYPGEAMTATAAFSENAIFRPPSSVLAFAAEWLLYGEPPHRS